MLVGEKMIVADLSDGITYGSAIVDPVAILNLCSLTIPPRPFLCQTQDAVADGVFSMLSLADARVKVLIFRRYVANGYLKPIKNKHFIQIVLPYRLKDIFEDVGFNGGESTPASLPLGTVAYWTWNKQNISWTVPIMVGVKICIVCRSLLGKWMSDSGLLKRRNL